MYILKFTQLFRKYLSHISTTFYSDNSVLNEAIKNTQCASFPDYLSL